MVIMHDVSENLLFPFQGRMDSACSSETFVLIYQTAQRQIVENGNFNTHRSEEPSVQWVPAALS
jgi:hypothetical protein